MYVNSAFKTDEIAAWDFVVDRGFGAIVAIDQGTPVSAHVPLLVTGEGDKRCVEFHVARANPLHDVIAANPRVLVTVWGPDAYISPDWYVSADQVPTWNYVAAHLTGTAHAMAPEQALDHVERIECSFKLSQNKTVTDRMEAARMLDWRGSHNERGMAAAMRDALKATASATLKTTKATV